jgi:hypothetical protein
MEMERHELEVVPKRRRAILSKTTLCHYVCHLLEGKGLVF